MIFDITLLEPLPNQPLLLLVGGHASEWLSAEESWPQAEVKFEGRSRHQSKLVQVSLSLVVVADECYGDYEKI